MNNDVINKIDNLIEVIKDSDIYKEYVDMLNKVDNSNEIKELSNDIRKLNKKMITNPSIALDKLLKEKEDALNNIPLYNDYKDKLNELNNLLLVVKNKVDTFIKDVIIE